MKKVMLTIILVMFTMFPFNGAKADQVEHGFIVKTDIGTIWACTQILPNGKVICSEMDKVVVCDPIREQGGKLVCEEKFI